MMPNVVRFDPDRFFAILDAAEGAGWITRAIANQEAETIARAAGYTLVEALRLTGRLPGGPMASPPADATISGHVERPASPKTASPPAPLKNAHLCSSVSEPNASHPSTTLPLPLIRSLGADRAARILAVLAADPSRSDRAISRELRCSPTLIGRARAAAGLASAMREVCRGGSAYAMRPNGASHAVRCGAGAGAE